MSSYRRKRSLALSATALAAVASMTVLPVLPAAPASAGTASQRPATARPARGSAPGLTAEQASARARATHAPVPVTGMTTATSQTTAEPDGSYTLTQSAQPVRARRGDTWLPLDPTLHAQADGTVRPAVTTAEVVLSGGGSGALATLTAGARSLALTFPAALPHPTLSGDQATYANVYPGVDLVVTVSEQGGVSEVLRVADAKAAANPALATLRFATSTRGLAATADAAGDLTFADPSGHTVYAAPAPQEWDSSVPAAPATAATRATSTQTTATPAATAPDGEPLASSPRRPGAGAHRAGIRATVDPGHLTLTPDPALLHSPTTRFPVYVDPAITFNPDSYGGTGYGWTEVDHNTDGTATGIDGQSFWDESGDVKVGNNDGTAIGWGGFYPPYFVARGYFQWNISALRGDLIKDASFQSVEHYSPTCGSGGDTTVDIYAVAGTIGSGTTWKNKPAMTTKIGSDSRMLGYSSSCPAAAISASLTSTVNSSLAGTGNGMITVGLEADSESTSWGWKAFDHKNTNITIHYDVKPSTPSHLGTSPITRCLTSTQTPYDVIGNTDIGFSALTGQPDGKAKPLNVTFTVKNSAGANIAGSPDVIQVTAGSPANITLPKSAFTSGAYNWTVSAYDGYATSTTAGPCYFTVDDTQPAPPGVVPADGKYPQNATGAPVRTPGEFTFSAAAAATFRWALNDGPWTTVAATSNAWTGYITPTHVGPNTLSVQGISVGGNYSAISAYSFTADKPATPDADGDLTGTGHPGLVTVGGSAAGAPAGLWYAPGDGAGHLGTALDLGRAGSGANTAGGSSADFTGATAIHGDFHGVGLQDVVAYWPANGTATAQAVIYRGSGDATPLSPTTFTDNVVITADPLSDGTNTPTQFANGGYISGQTLPDLITVSSGDLWLIASNGTVGQYQSGIGNGSPNLLISSSPDGGADDWNNFQVTTALDATGGTTVFFRNINTGAVGEFPMAKLQSVWAATTTPVVLGAADATAVTLPSGAPAASASLMQGADIDHDGHADLWFTSASNAPGATSQSLPVYPAGQPSGLGSSPLLLATALGAWPLDDGSNSTAFADPTGQNPAAISSPTTVGWSQDPVHGTVPTFDGKADQAQATGTGLDTSRSFTVSAWVNMANVTADNAVITMPDTATKTSPFYLEYLKSSNAWAFRTTNGDVAAPTFGGAVGSVPVATGTWVHLAAEYDAAGHTVTLFVNGTEAASASGITLWTSPGPLTIGSSGGSAYFPGKLSDVEAYQAAMPYSWIAEAGLGAAAHRWKLDDGAATAGTVTASDSGGTDAGTLNGGVSWVSDATRGEVASFNGTTGAVTLPAQAGPAGSAPFTMSLWFKTTHAGGILMSTQSQPLGSTTTGSDFDTFYVGTDGYLYGSYWTTTGGTIKSLKTVTDGAWHHATLASAATTQTLYLDGIDMGETTTTAAMGATGHAFDYIGAGTSGNGWPALPNLASVYFNGQISDVRVYNEAESAGQAFTDSAGEGAAVYFNDGKQYSVLPNAVMNHCNTLTCVSFAPSKLTVSNAGTGAAMWTTTANTTSTGYITLLTNGSLAIYPTPGGASSWATTTTGNPGDVLAHQTDGNLVLYTSTGHVLWATNTF